MADLSSCSHRTPSLTCAMQARPSRCVVTGLLSLGVVLALTLAADPATPNLIAKGRSERLSPTDLAIGGELAGVPPGTTRFLTRQDLLSLPQVTYKVENDPNFVGSPEISGVPLDDLNRLLANSPDSAVVIAICDDEYHAHYPRAYVAAHRPLLVLKINGQPPDRWPKDGEGHGADMGPYMISHPHFVPSFKTLAHSDEAQIPWGVVRLEFRSEAKVLGAIAPRGPNASESQVQSGYRIAEQNCFRCHNMGNQGGQKARHPWLVLSAWAQSSPSHFAAYVRNPKLENPGAQMPGNLAYDDATLQALIAYFRTFQSAETR